MKNKKAILKARRHHSIRQRITGASDRPRLAVYRGSRNIIAQVIDDTKKQTLFSMTTADKEIKEKCPYGGNIKTAVFFGETFARKAKEKGIFKVVFDRAGYLYHGRIKAFADAARKGGLKF